MEISNHKRYGRYIDAEGHVWIHTHLIWNARELEIVQMPIDELQLEMQLLWKMENIRDFIVHMEKVNNADLNYPIIVSAEGHVMDGMHRIVKAILRGNKSVRGVKFPVTPPPDYKEEK